MSVISQAELDNAKLKLEHAVADYRKYHCEENWDWVCYQFAMRGQVIAASKGEEYVRLPKADRDAAIEKEFSITRPTNRG